MATNYFWDEIEDNVVEEYDDNGNTLVSYTTEPTLYGSVLSQDRDGEVRHYQFDGQGNTTELTDESGDVTDTRRYSGFGELNITTGMTVFSRQWGGQWGYSIADLTVNLLAIRFRMYAVSSGRWLSFDPCRFTETAFCNHFQFTKGNPLAWRDPSGCIEETSTKAGAPKNGIDDAEKGKFKNCTCDLFDVKLGGKVAGLVKCDGKGGFMVDVAEGKNIGDPILKACWACGLEGCTKEHEEHHIKQFKAICPNVCGCQPSGPKSVGFTDDDCKYKGECYGWAVFYACLKKVLQDKFKNDAKTKCDAPVGKLCRDVIQALIQGGPPIQAKLYQCDKHGITITPK